MLNILIPYIDRHFGQFNKSLGLAELVTDVTEEETRRYPVIMVAGGQGQQIDMEGGTSYHRLRSAKTIEYTEDNTIGCSKGIRLTYPMYFIGSMPNDCQYSNDSLSNGISNALNKVLFEKQLRRSLKAWSIAIEVIEINTNGNDVFEQEYTNVKTNIDYSNLYLSISYNIIIDADSSCLDDGCEVGPVPFCEDAIVLVNGESFQVVQSGKTLNIQLVNEDDETITPIEIIGSKIVLPDPVDSVPVTNSDGSYTSTASLPEYEIPDTQITLKNDIDDILSVTNFPSAFAGELIAPDGVGELFDTDGNLLSTKNIPSGTTLSIIAPDGHVSLKKSSGVALRTVDVMSNETVNETIADSVVSLRDSLGVLISTNNVLAETPTNITAPDATVNLNGGAFLTPESNSTVDVTTVSIDGVTIPPSVSGAQLTIPIFSDRLLDTYEGADFAYSLELLRAAYYGRPFIRVRRSGDNAEADFGSNTVGRLDEVSLLAFVIAGGGTQNGFVTTWYDQTGHLRHLTNATGAQQPSIVLSGVVNTEAGKPTVAATGGQSLLHSLVGANPTYGQPATIWVVAKSTGAGAGIFGGLAGGRLGILAGSGTTWLMVSNATLNSGITNTNRVLAYALFNGAALSVIALNGAAGTTGNAGSAGTISLRLFNDVGGGPMTGNIQEVVGYFSIQSANKTAIETNINERYGIY